MSNKTTVFKRTPSILTDEEKVLKEREFLSFDKTSNLDVKTKESRVIPQKESVKPLFLRAPISYWTDIQEIMAITGLSMNAVCLELLRPALKKKLKELKEDF